MYDKDILGNGKGPNMRIISFVVTNWLIAFPAQVAWADLTDAQAALMQAADVVILGEVHDNPEHHLGQGRLIRQLAPRAVVFEMLSPVQAAQINNDTRSDLQGLGRRIGWNNAGWPDFEMYRPVFEALGDAPVIGAALPREQVRAAFETGAAAVFGTDGSRFGLDQPVPTAQQDTRANLQFDAHCAAMPMGMMDGMIEAQRLRDAQFSAATLAAMEQFGSPVVVITGNGHARKDWAMPAMIARAAPQVAVFSVGFVESPADPADPRYDATVVTIAASRPDPCAAFKQ